MSKLIRQDVEKKIDDLLSKMTMEEKVGQLNQLGPSLVGGFGLSFEDLIGMMLDGKISKDEFDKTMEEFKEDLHEDLIRQGKIGSLNGIYGAEKINNIQKVAVEESRLGIPLIIGVDIIHGYRTIFPIPLAESCSFEPELARKSAEIAAREASAAGIHWTFAPMLDIARDPRWGRIAEGAGEDTYLTSKIAAAKVKGFQGDDLSERDRIVACAKHFIAYGGAVGGRDYNTVDMSLQTLYDIYLPPFEAAALAGAGTFMCSFNDLNGIPCTINKHILTEVLRNKLGFKGFVVSDANSIEECFIHGAAEDKKDAGKKALLAGVEMDMSSNSYIEYIPELVNEGDVSMEALDKAVRRILRIKFLKGLFDNPYISDSNREKETILCEEHIAAARETARRSIVLLKNEEKILPLKKDLKKIAVIGPLADNGDEMLGSWAFTGKSEDAVTVLSGIRSTVGNETEILYSKGCEIEGESTDGFNEAITVAREADVIIAIVGESKLMSGEAASRADLCLPGKQEELLKELKNTGKPLIVVLINGRPLAITWAAENASAIVETWQLGIQAGNAIADVLFGDYNPSGKLTVSFPHCVGQVPLYYNHPNTGRPAGNFKFTSKYMDAPLTPLYPFGYGLSYTTFMYENLAVNSLEATLDGTLNITANVTNTGDVPGEEVVQLYVRDLVASRVRPVKELKGFEKISLNPGESKSVTFDLKVSELGFHDEELNYIVEPGTFKVWVGTNSQEGLEGEFKIK